MYDPSIGRWMEEDPSWPDGHVNPYVFSDNNHTNQNILGGTSNSLSSLVMRQFVGLINEEKVAPKAEAFDGNKYGKWKIVQENQSDVLGPFESRVTIDFMPNKDIVNATEIAFVSIIRILNTKTGKSVPVDRIGKPQSLRMTDDFWFVDVKEGRKFGWYAYNNDGMPEMFNNVGLKKLDVQGVYPGSSPGQVKNATFKDFPGDPNETPAFNVSFQFETYAIAKTGKDKGTIYGGVTWGFDVAALSKMTSRPRKFLTVSSSQFKNAVQLWDKQATGPEKDRNDPKQIVLGPVIKFPS